jgi:hypothetical protein
MRFRGPTGRGSRLAAVALGALVVLGLPAPASAVGSVSGQVTGAGRPLANAWVEYTPVTPSGDWAGRGGVTSTDEQGRYRLPDLDVAHVKIQVRTPVSGGFVATYWPAAYTFGTAGVLRVTPGAVADVNLVRGGSVRGQVVDAATGLPVVGARVTAHAVTGAGWESVGSPALRVGAVPGSFSIGDLPPIPVALQAGAPPGSNYLSTWYDGAGFLDQAQRIDGGADTSALVIALPEGAELSGTVRDDRGEPVSGAAVSLIGCPGLCPLMDLTDSSGTYRIPAVPPGRGMLLRASSDAQGYVPQWYRRASESQEARLELAGGQVLSGLDLVLTRGAFLTATIVDDRTGNPLAGISAELVSLTNPLLGYLPGSRDTLIARAATEFLAGAGAAGPAQPPPGAGVGAGPDAAEPDPAPSNGPGTSGTQEPAEATFTIGPAPPGTYRLVVYPGQSNRAYLPVVWGDSQGIDRTGVVRLGPGDRVTAVVRLIRRSPAPAAGSGQTGLGSSPEAVGEPGTLPVLGNQGGWPGLFAGFLGAGAREGWPG